MLDQQQSSAQPLDQIGNYDIYSQLQMVANNYTNFTQPVPAISLEDTPTVLGFTFPLATEDDIDRLEMAVQQSSLIRGQYVRCYVMFGMILLQPADDLFAGAIPQRGEAHPDDHRPSVQQVLLRPLDDQLQLLRRGASRVSQNSQKGHEKVRCLHGVHAR